MKNRIILIAVLCSVCWITSFAQIHVDEDQDIGIGITNTTNSRVDISNSTNDCTIRLDNRINADSTYGINNLISGNVTDVSYGVYSILENSGGGNIYGLYSVIDTTGTGAKIGVYNEVKHNVSSLALASGIVNRMEGDGLGQMVGITNKSKGIGSGERIGIRNVVPLNPNSNGQVYGIENVIKVESTVGGEAYGVANIMTPKANSVSDVYGSYTVIDTLGSGNQYGVYSNVSASRDSCYAGYFVGDIVVTGDIDNPSDERLKQNIKDIGNCIEIIKKLKPRSYQFKDSDLYRYTGKEEFGFVAQELETILPNLVRTIEHPKHKITYEEQKDVDGELITKPVITPLAKESYKAINYRGLMPIMIQAVKEQQALIEQLQEQIAKQQEQIEKLIERVDKGSK